jgi:putative transposase
VFGFSSLKGCAIGSPAVREAYPGYMSKHSTTPNGVALLRLIIHYAVMSTYTQITYHLVFATKNRTPVLHKNYRPELFAFIYGVLKNRNCHTFRINGVEDHLHILTTLHPSISLANLVKEIKTSSSAWMKSRKGFEAFEHWQEGYGAFTPEHCIQCVVPTIERNALV